MGQTSIEWTDHTWNPVRGCSPVSPGCKNCYAERQGGRFAGPGRPFDGFVQIGKNGRPGARWTGKVELIEKHLMDPLGWKKPQRVFVNSMSDLFHEALPDEAIDRIFAVMALCPQHTFQILTKRPERMLRWTQRKFITGDVQIYVNCMGARLPGSAVLRHSMKPEVRKMLEGDPPFEAAADFQDTDIWPLPNVWLGVSVEDQKTADERIPLLLQTPAAIRFVSYEPALGPVDFTTLPSASGIGRYLDALSNAGVDPGALIPNRLDQIIVGGESGPGARPFDIAWARNTIAQCKASGVACFVKQLGAHPYTTFGTPSEQELGAVRDRKGGDMSEWPEDLRVREFPTT